ncbi:MAG TPA: glycoside hydrolase family 43 protein [Acidimicrobiales bacterium]|nr:glycoside hydrolase family 43 protein [Acidimicrobiales bacterium]
MRSVSRVPVRTALAVIATLFVVATVGFIGSGQTGGAVVKLTVPRIGAAQVVDQNDVADPTILTVGPTYYLFGTTDWRSNVPTATSTDLVHWDNVPDALPVLPQWAQPSISMTWAPAVIAVGRRYVMYVTTEERASGRQCIAVATSASPGGPYADGSAQPFLCQRTLGGSIDPDAVRDSRGALHLVWKSDGNCCGLGSSLWEQDLSPDGLHLVGRSHRLLGADQAWEAGNVEGPALVQAATGWWMFFSGGDWRTASYATGIAWCRAIEGPCRDVLTRPLLPSTDAGRTPSGLSTFVDAHGGLWAAFTTTVLVPSRLRPGRYYDNRVLDVAPLVTR